jgi:hypothetical protein
MHDAVTPLNIYCYFSYPDQDSNLGLYERQLKLLTIIPPLIYYKQHVAAYHSLPDSVMHLIFKSFNFLKIRIFFRFGRDSNLGPSIYQPGMLTIRPPVIWELV